MQEYEILKNMGFVWNTPAAKSVDKIVADYIEKFEQEIQDLDLFFGPLLGEHNNRFSKAKFYFNFDLADKFIPDGHKRNALHAQGVYVNGHKSDIASLGEIMKKLEEERYARTFGTKITGTNALVRMTPGKDVLDQLLTNVALNNGWIYRVSDTESYGKFFTKDNSYWIRHQKFGMAIYSGTGDKIFTDGNISEPQMIMRAVCSELCTYNNNMAEEFFSFNKT